MGGVFKGFEYVFANEPNYYGEKGKTLRKNCVKDEEHNLLGFLVFQVNAGIASCNQAKLGLCLEKREFLKY